jgi:DNA ligase (NAD+)
MSNSSLKENSQQLLNDLPKMSEAELTRLIKHHNQRYFEAFAPEISDEVFDKLVSALRAKNPAAAVLQELGEEITDLTVDKALQVTHRSAMLSLDKCYDEDTFNRWREKIRCDLIAMPKIDGVACSIVFKKDGTLMIAATRGDGEKGENITENVRLIQKLPTQLNPGLIAPFVDLDGFLEIRGEVFIPLSNFNEKFAEAFTSPRNLAAGALKQKESQKSLGFDLHFFPYDVRGANIATEEEKFGLLKALGFMMMPWQKVTNDDQAIRVFADFLTNAPKYDFETDGVVFRANLLAEQTRMGATAHHPRFAIAYKFQSESAQTTLTEVTWSVARTGVITPVAHFKPVFLSGAKISRATLHNLRMFTEHDIRETSLIEINRRGGVIPYVERVLSREGEPLLPPALCPSCEKPTIADGDFLHCPAPDQCVEVRINRIIHFTKVAEMEGLGPKIIRRLFEVGKVASMADIFRLTEQDLLAQERMGSILAAKLIGEIQRRRHMDLATFVYALGIHDIGDTIAQLVAANFPSLADIRALDTESVIKIHGIGATIAENLVSGLHALSDEIDDLEQFITITQKTVAADLDETHPLFNKVVVFTGKMAHLERKAAQDLVKKLGGQAPGAFSSKVDYLVVGDEGSPLLGDGKKSTKQKEAEKFISEGRAIAIISEGEFLKVAKG